MSMNFYAGIDGGGTKTTVICRNADGSDLDKRLFGPFNINGIGEKAFFAMLEDIVSYLSSLGTCTALCIGAAGISNQTMQNLVSSAMKKANIERWKLVGDHEIALFGALEGRSGIGLIAGTGSICFGRGVDGRLERSGGWGHLIGDEGSGYGLGRDALGYVARQLDGIGQETLITRLLAQKMGLASRSDIISYVYSHDKTAVSDLSPIVEEAYFQSDSAAVSIVKANAQALVTIVASVAEKLSLSPARVALLGGLISHKTCMRDELVSLLGKARPDLTCIEPVFDAATGAVMMAGEMLDEQ